jgi:rRNA-processing protein FCF1
MRHGRAKASRRTLQFYKLNAPHLVRSPIRILLDGTFLVSSIRNKVPLRERLSKLLQGEEFVCHVTRSTLVELSALGERFGGKSSAARGGRATAGGVGGGGDGGVVVGNGDDGDDDDDEEDADVFSRARRYGLDECVIVEDAGRDDDAKTEDGKRTIRGNASGTIAPTAPAIVGLSSIASGDVYALATAGGETTDANSHSYFVATQDEALSDALRAIPYVPLLRLGRAVLLLESPSAASRHLAGTNERKKMRNAGGNVTPEERDMLLSVRGRDASRRIEDARSERRKIEMRSRGEIGGGYSDRKRKRAKGPNPLSCKRGKK